MASETRPRTIPVQRYDFPDEDIDYVLGELRTLLADRDFLTLGRYGELFEEEFAAYSGARYAVAVNSGTAALEIILRGIGVEGADVIVPTNTFAATAYAVIHAGGRPIFADCGDDLCVDPDDVERRLTPATKAVIAVHIGGLISPGILRLRELCEERGLALVEDAAHAHGSRLDGLQPGSFGVAAAYSFFSTKVITTGEGGMITTGDEGLAVKARLLRDQAKVAGQNRHDVVGYNWRLTEFQAIVGLAQLRRLDEFISDRLRIAAVYDSVLQGASEHLRPLSLPDGADPNFYKNIVVLDGIDVETVSRELASRHGVRLGGFVYDVPCHEQPAFQSGAVESLPRAEDLCRRHICPPIYPSLSDADAKYIAEALLEVVS
jgi:dTDP-4-amino-4,6-dideoxygalactose transaminase